MINLLRRVRQQYLSEGNYRIYAIYAMGEVVLVMAGILLALQVDNWNQNRQQKELEIDNLENLYFSLNENIQINSLILLTEYTLRIEDTWLAYLSGDRSLNDSLLEWGYAIGATNYIHPNYGFYESLKQRGLETIENESLRVLLSIIYEQHLPELQTSMSHFRERFSEERNLHFRKYFALGDEHLQMWGKRYSNADQSLFRVAYLKDESAMLNDLEFLEFIRTSRIFHEILHEQLVRTQTDILKAKTLISHELNFARYGSPKRQEVRMFLEGFQDVSEVFITGEFNNWRPDGSMIRTHSGWERSFDLFPGTYEYKFFIRQNDDTHDPVNWIVDPANPDSIYVPEVGSYNSVLTVPE